MGMVMSAIFKLIKLYIIVFALSLQGSKGLTISPSPIQVTLGPSSNGKPFTSDPPSSVPRPIGSFPPPELAAPPSVAEASPPSDSDPPISMPVDLAPSFHAPTVPPTGSQEKEPVIETPSSMPVAPITTPPMISPPVQPNSPETSPPTEPITPVSIASPPRELGKSPPVPVVISPSQPPKLSPFIDPTSPRVSPSMLPDHTISPMPSPPTISNWKNEAVPVAAPSNEKPNPSSPPMTQIPAKNGSNISPGPSNLLPKSHTDGHPPALSPSKSFEKPYKPRNRTTNLAPAPSHPLSPPTSKDHGPAVPPAPFRARIHSHHAPPPGPPPLNSDAPISPSHVPFSPPASHVSPTPAPSQQASYGNSRIFPSKPPSESPKAPLLPQLRAFPPPPPNEDCSAIICTEPYTNTPPGSRCGCVMPIQVGLRLSVSLYTFFPLVSELAGEIAAGVSIRQSQVRIIGANAANQEPDKTVILVDLVPLGERFDNATAFSTYRRFWNKQVAIQTIHFGDYEVLYVRYPGLPESPPSGAGVTDDGPYPGSNNNGGRKIKPLGVDLPKSQRKNGPSGGVIAVIVLSASLAVILCVIAAWIFLFKNRDGGSQPRPKNAHVLLPALSKVSGSRGSSATLSFGSSVATFTASEIERATDHFEDSRVLGEGGFGRVYGGVLEDGTKVAVKVLKRDDQQGGREFLAEVEMLGRLHHRNLVKLIGICTEDRARCLVYELIPNGSVESHLHGIDKESAPLNWGARIKIALGAARGLAYLHEDSSPRVIHRDFKSSNILLEDDFTPKVSDFGLARTALDGENRHISTRVMGTFGYVAPEYAMTGHLLVKSDVYSYGVVLLELLTGRKPVDMSQPPGEENLVAWARPLLTSREGLETIADRSLVGPGPGPTPAPFDSVAKVAAIASMCVQPEVSNRPFMGEVVQALKLVCNEIDDDDLSLGTGSPGPVPRSQSSAGSFGSPEIGASELFGGGAAAAEEEEEFRRRSCSGPLGSSRTRPFWDRVRRSSSSRGPGRIEAWSTRKGGF